MKRTTSRVMNLNFRLTVTYGKSTSVCNLSIAIESVSNTLSIKIQIAGRSYPLKVTPEQQVVLEKAATAVNDRLKEYEKAYGVRDIQDLLSMCALHMAAEQMGFRKNQLLEEDKINKELQALADLVKAFDK